MDTMSYNELYNHCAIPCIKCIKAEKSYSYVEPATETANAETKTAETGMVIDSDPIEILYYMIDNIVHDIWQACGCNCDVKAVYHAVGQAMDMLIDYERYIKDGE